MSRDDLAARVDDAVGFYEGELARFAELRAVHGPTVPDGAATAGPQLVRLLHDLNTAKQPTWAWPLPGGEDQWHRIAREVKAEIEVDRATGSAVLSRAEPS